jgi:hypothetical protein
MLLLLGFLSGGEGGITRRYAPRPFGAALRALSPLRRCRSQLIQTDENLCGEWRRGRDCSRLRRSSSASLRTVAAALRRPKSPSAILSNPLSISRARIPALSRDSNLNENGENLPAVWRRGRDYSALRASPLRGRPDGRYPRFVAVAVN